METQSKNISNLRQLLEEECIRLINSEIQLRNNLPDWVSKDNNIPLKLILHRYLDRIDDHINYINKFLEEDQISCLSHNDSVMQASIGQINDKITCCNAIQLKDLCLLSGIQTINHYKISLYRSVANLANILGMESATKYFHIAQQNENKIDEELSSLATLEINDKALATIPLN